MEIRFTKQEAQGIFLDALSNGLGYLSGYGLDLDYKKEDYKKAKEKLTSPCYEDVLLQILLDGNSLTLIDEEDEDNVNIITIQDVYDRISSTPFDHLSDMINGNDDATTADAILQTIFFNEIIYG
jgi:hypothetical protein